MPEETLDARIRILLRIVSRMQSASFCRVFGLQKFSVSYNRDSRVAFLRLEGLKMVKNEKK